MMFSVMHGCGSTTPVPPVDPPPMKKVVFQWEPGVCTDMYRLYRLTNSGRKAVGESKETTITLVIQPTPSQWQVSGRCDGEEFFSTVATLQP